MKTFPLPRGGRLSAGILVCVFAISGASASDSSVPRGSLTVNRNLVQIGTRTQLSWAIEYPAPITSVVDIVTPNIIKPKKDLKMRVRVLGSAQAKSNNGHGNNLDGVDSSNPGKGVGGPNGAIDLSGLFDDERKGSTAVSLPVEVMWSLNNAPWTRLFHSYPTAGGPSTLVLETMVHAGDVINFGGRGWRDGAWLPFYSTTKSTPNLIILENGDQVPSTVPALNGTAIESFLKPYMDTTTKEMKIGDRDLILLMELGQSTPLSSGFDLQDLVVLVTFE